jgi:hypothetical protein
MQSSTDFTHFTISTDRASIDRVYLNDLTIKAFQERAKLRLLRDQLSLEHANAEESLAAVKNQLLQSDQTLRDLEYFHQIHAANVS